LRTPSGVLERSRSRPRPHRRLRPSQVHRLRGPSGPAVRGSRAVQPDGRRLHQPGRAIRCRLRLPVRRTAVLATPGRHRRAGERRHV